MSTTSIFSFAEFEQLPDEPGKTELLDGELIVSPPPIRDHSVIARQCETHLWLHWPRNEVWMESGFKIGDQFLLPDVSVIYPDQPFDGKYWAGAPAIVVEVRSPSNTAAALQRKVEVYLLNTIRPATEVWVVEDRRKSVTVYRLSGEEITLVRRSAPFTCSYGNVTIDPSTFFVR
jgi:Uma2 family endonuclease